MDKKIDMVIKNISEAYAANLSGSARHYLEVNIGKAAEKMGFEDITDRYKDAYAVVPLKRPVSGMKVRIDGRTFVGYKQYESGVAVPGYVARDAALRYVNYVPNGSMILNFA